MQVNEALKSVATFLRGLRVTDEGVDLAEGFTQFSDEEFGGLTLTGRERTEYIKCLDDLVESVAKHNSFSRRGVERLLQTTILRGWSAEDGSAQMPDDRIKRAIEWLRDAIRAEPKSYLAYLPLLGIDSSNLPTAVGNVTFLPGDSRTIATMKRPVSTIIKSSKNEEASKKALRKHVVEDINNTFRNGVVGELVVQAGDDDNAEEKAVRECRRTIDAINFFSDIFASSGMRSRVSLLGDGNQVVSLASKKERTRLMVLMREKYDSRESSILYKGRQIAGFTCPGYARGPLLALRLPKADSRPALDSGFARVSELLANGDKTSLEDRILSAFQWAGRATVEVRREEAFLLYMIALESLVLGGKAASEITFQLKIKTAHLIKSRSEDRKNLLKRLGALYNIRSKIVHSGSFQVTDSELRETRQYTKQALLTVAIGKPFRSMKTEEEFDGWLEERLLS